jgi:hypothetical protein
MFLYHLLTDSPDLDIICSGVDADWPIIATGKFFDNDFSQLRKSNVFFVFVIFIQIVEDLSLDFKDPRWGKKFNNLKVAKQYLYSVGLNGGFGISSNSIKDNHRTQKVAYFHCHRGYGRKSQATKRITSTKKTGCMWKCALRWTDKNQFWVIDQVLNSTTGELSDHTTHNHQPFQSPDEFAIYRRLDLIHIMLTQKLSRASIKPRHIMTSLDKKEGFNPVMKDIYNARQKIRALELNGRDPITALIDFFRLNKWYFNVQNDNDGKLLSLFCAHPNSIKLALRFPHVYGVDATYKTNDCSLPCLHFVGTTSLNKSFSAAFCFMMDETQSTYEWALDNFKLLFDGCDPDFSPRLFATDSERALINSIETVFPESQHMLCLWHINKNIESYIKTNSKVDVTKFLKLWNQLCFSQTNLDYQNSKDIIKNYLLEFKADKVLKYLENKWYPQDHKFVYMYTSKLRHFGYGTTSKTEGTHYAIKKDLEHNKHDLYSTIMHFVNALDIQYQEILGAVRGQKTKKLNKFHSIFDSLHGKVSQFAIKKANDQLKLILDTETTTDCTHNFASMWGIPCSHQLRTYLEIIEAPVQVEDFDSHWHLYLEYPPRNLAEVRDRINSHIRSIKDEEETFLIKFESDFKKLISGRYALVPILPPTKKIDTKGRPKGAKNKKLKRDPSRFEYVAKAEKQRKMTCGKCGGKGHDRRGCDVELSNGEEDEDDEDDEDATSNFSNDSSDISDLTDLNGLDDSHNSDSNDNPDFDDLCAEKEEQQLLRSLSCDDEEDLHGDDDDLPGEQEVADYINAIPYNEEIIQADYENDLQFYHLNHLQDPDKIETYRNDLIEFVRPYITSVYDPPGDGHCGFHAIAHAIGRDGIDGMLYVRQAMAKDLDIHHEEYVKYYWQKTGTSSKAKKSMTKAQIKQKSAEATESAIQLLSQKIDSNQTSPAFKFHWFESTTMGLIAANTFERPVIIIGPNELQCNTFLPFSSKKKLTNSPIALGFVNSEHWVSLTFSSDSPSPFPKASLWKDAYRIWTSIAGRNAAGWMNDVFLKGCFELWDKEVEEMEQKKGKNRRVTRRSSKKRKVVEID